MPAEQPLVRQRLVIAARGVEHHLDDAFDVAVRGLEAADVEAQTPRHRRADLFGIELLTFDFAGLQDVFGQRFEDGFLLKAKAEAFHLPDEPPLPVTNRGQRLCELLHVPAKVRPVLPLVNIHSPHPMRRLYPIDLRILVQIFSAYSAEKARSNLRRLDMGG